MRGFEFFQDENVEGIANTADRTDHRQRAALGRLKRPEPAFRFADLRCRDAASRITVVSARTGGTVVDPLPNDSLFFRRQLVALRRHLAGGDAFPEQARLGCGTSHGRPGLATQHHTSARRQIQPRFWLLARVASEAFGLEDRQHLALERRLFGGGSRRAAEQ